MSVSRREFLAAAGAAGITGALAGLEWVTVCPPPVGFEPRIGLTRGPEHAPLLKELGADFLEISCGHLMPTEPEEKFKPRRKELLNCGLPIHGANGFLPSRLKSTGPDADHAAIAKYAEVIFRRGGEIGMRTVTFGSSGSRSLPEGFPKADAELQFVALLMRLAPIAEKHGVRVCVEPLQARETNFIHFVREAARLVEAVQHPSIGITADVFHMLRGDEGPDAIREAGAHVQHVHLAEKAERTAPGVAGDDFTPYLQALADIGYDGPISMECGWGDLREQFPVALRTLRTQLEGVA